MFHKEYRERKNTTYPVSQQLLRKSNYRDVNINKLNNTQIINSERSYRPAAAVP